MCTYAPNGNDTFKAIQTVWKIKLTLDDMKGLQNTRLFMKKTEKVRCIRKKQKLTNFRHFVCFVSSLYLGRQTEQ